MKLVERTPATSQPSRLCHCRCRRCGVRRYGVVPQSQASEDMGGHMERVRRIRSDLGIGARRLEAQFGGRRIVQAVNEVVGHTWVVLMPRQQVVENLPTLFLPRIRLIRRIKIANRDQLEGVENRSLVIIRMALADLGQCLLVSLYAASVIDRLPILIKHSQGIDVVALALGLCASGQSALYSLFALLQLIWRRRRPYRVIPSPGNTPVSYATR